MSTTTGPHFATMVALLARAVSPSLLALGMATNAMPSQMRPCTVAMHVHTRHVCMWDVEGIYLMHVEPSWPAASSPHSGCDDLSPHAERLPPQRLATLVTGSSVCAAERCSIYPPTSGTARSMRCRHVCSNGEAIPQALSFATPRAPEADRTADPLDAQASGGTATRAPPHRKPLSQDKPTSRGDPPCRCAICLTYHLCQTPDASKGKASMRGRRRRRDGGVCRSARHARMRQRGPPGGPAPRRTHAAPHERTCHDSAVRCWADLRDSPRGFPTGMFHGPVAAASVL